MTETQEQDAFVRGDPPPRLLLVVAQPARRVMLRAEVRRVLPSAQLTDIDNVLDAILSSARRPADLLLLDHAIDGAAAPALITNLGRVAPRTEVMVFDELADVSIDRPRGGAVRPWDEVDAALRDWWTRWQGRASGGGVSAR